MFDPYSRDTPGLADPALNLFDITPDDANDLPMGIKALRIFNPNDTTATIHVITATGNEVAFNVPALALWTEPLRVKRVLEATSAGVILQGYTDRPYP